MPPDGVWCLHGSERAPGADMCWPRLLTPGAPGWSPGALYPLIESVRPPQAGTSLLCFKPPLPADPEDVRGGISSRSQVRDPKRGSLCVGIKGDVQSWEPARPESAWGWPWARPPPPALPPPASPPRPQLWHCLLQRMLIGWPVAVVLLSGWLFFPSPAVSGACWGWGPAVACGFWPGTCSSEAGSQGLFSCGAAM